MWKFSSLVFMCGILTTLCENKSAKVIQPHKVVCYLGSWANYRNGDGKFLIEDIDPTLCTHLIYGFAKLSNGNKIAAYDPYLDLKENWGLGAYERFNGLKKKNPNLKTLIAIGGWNEGSIKYSNMAKSPSSRKVFIDSCVNFIKTYGFDGLDLDWEYPAMRGGSADDKKNFIHLLKELKEAFKPHNFLLTSAVSAGQNTIDAAYDVPALAKYLDFINLMAYDFHGGWDQVTGHNSPLYSHPEDTSDNFKLNVDYAVKYWLKKGAPAEKLILGMPLYGRSFALSNAQENGLKSLVTGKGMAGEYTREQGFLGYNEICKKLQSEKGWILTLDKYIQAPYIVKDRQWIGFDDMKSIAVKVDYLLKMKLGGAMIWSIETDDFRGKCHGYSYPLLKTINSVLNGTSLPLPEPDFDEDNSIFPVTHTISSNVPYTVATSPTINVITSSTRSNRIPTKFPESEDLTCSETGYFRHPKDCKFFYLCQSLKPGSDSGYRIYLFECGSGTLFSEKMHICAFPVNVPECFEKKNK